MLITSAIVDNPRKSLEKPNTVFADTKEDEKVKSSLKMDKARIDDICLINIQ